MSMRVYAFEVTVRGKPEWGQTINTTSPGKARYAYLLDIWDSWPDVTFADLKVRKVGLPVTPESFTRTAAYRGLPHVRCGDRVDVGGHLGTIVGSNPSANFDVLFDDDASDDYAGQTLNCHPHSDMTFLERPTQ